MQTLSAEQLYWLIEGVVELLDGAEGTVLGKPVKEFIEGCRGILRCFELDTDPNAICFCFIKGKH